jgi:glycosyltransferase involved in cell wall biosynthesis
LIQKNIDYNVVLTHTTPEFWEKHKEAGKAFVGYTIWETTKLHPQWPVYINGTADACLVGCEWNVKTFKDSGVTIPVFNVPHCVSLDSFKKVAKMSIQGVKDSTFVFYSVLQFTERKCPTELIKAYWRAFQNDEDVALVLKTYRSDYSDGEKEAIRTTVKRLKIVSPAKKYPPIFLLLDMLPEEEINALHNRGDCFVSLDRGEGFGLGAFQAGAVGNPIVVTGFGGALEYAKPEHSYLVDYVETPVYGMPWSPWYLLEQDWAHPSATHGAKLMKHVFENQDEAKQKGLMLQKYIEKNFSRRVIGQKIVDAIKSI